MTRKTLTPEKQGRGRPREFDREKALHKALELFWEQGYMQTTMSQLCKAMRINSPSLYCAFGCKADLFLEAIIYYKRTYWRDAFVRFLNSLNIAEGLNQLMDDTARILLLPNAPCGCLTVFSALTLPLSETRILDTINKMRKETNDCFYQRLERARRENEIPDNANLEILTGSLVNFFEGLTLQARDKNISLEKLRKIALEGVRLLPDVTDIYGMKNNRIPV